MQSINYTLTQLIHVNMHAIYRDLESQFLQTQTHFLFSYYNLFVCVLYNIQALTLDNYFEHAKSEWIFIDMVEAEMQRVFAFPDTVHHHVT